MIKYREIPGYPAYYAGTNGRIYSEKWRNRKPLPGEQAPWRELVGTIGTRGYLSVGLYVDSHQVRLSVHQLVLLAFVGPCPDGMECRHENGIQTDNRLSNISWGTPSDNCQDKRRHGTYQCGERNAQAKFYDPQVLEIRRRWAAGESQRSLAKEFGVAKYTIYGIVYRLTWTHI